MKLIILAFISLDSYAATQGTNNSAINKEVRKLIS